MFKEITLKASMAYNDDDFRETVEAFAAGKFPGAESLITSRIPLEDVCTKGFDELVSNRDKHVKILVTPKQLSSSAPS
jgi:threonine dehydrogenase-like Zn-dependent dehydrogenase